MLDVLVQFLHLLILLDDFLLHPQHLLLVLARHFSLQIWLCCFNYLEYFDHLQEALLDVV